MTNWSPKSKDDPTPVPPPDLLAELYDRSGAHTYGIDESQFSQLLDSVAQKCFPASGADTSSTSSKDNSDFFRALRLEELALARACAAGNEKAWEVFLTRYREKLFDCARQIARDEATGRELADSIYADLYGTVAKDGQRDSKLNSYMGRGSLEGWLRTVLAQEFVNRYRKTKRFISLDEQIEEGAQFASTPAPPAAGISPELAKATDAVLASLRAEDRYILASYFLDQRTLAEIARTLRVHESTISRKVEKIAATIRKQIMERLIRGGMSRRQAVEAMSVDVRDLQIEVRTRLASAGQSGVAVGSLSLSSANVQEPGAKAFPVKEGKRD